MSAEAMMAGALVQAPVISSSRAAAVSGVRTTAAKNPAMQTDMRVPYCEAEASPGESIAPAQSVPAVAPTMRMGIKMPPATPEAKHTVEKAIFTARSSRSAGAAILVSSRSSGSGAKPTMTSG